MASSIYSVDYRTYRGKEISRITRDDSNIRNDLVMCDTIRIEFTDGTSIVLRPDWRGTECYISQMTQ
jgi:hypothetical protein